MKDAKPHIALCLNDPDVVRVLSSRLEADFKVSFAHSIDRLHSIALSSSLELTLITSNMSGMGIEQTIESYKSYDHLREIPLVIVDSQGTDFPLDDKAFAAGAVDVFQLPMAQNALCQRISNLLKGLSNSYYKQAFHNAMHIIGNAGHFFDEDTESHVWRMAGFSRLIGAQLGWDSKELDELQYAAAMHDTGKIGIPSDILTKPGRLNTAEWEIMKTHAKIGYELLSFSDHPILKMAADVALHHHEKWDGSGYPEGISGEKISLSARIVAVADVFDALTSDRPYKKAWPVYVAFKAIEEDSGSHFDPTVVYAFLSARSDVEALISHWNEVDAKRASERAH